MIDLTKFDDVVALQSNLRASLDTPQGQEVISFLEQVCGWYDFGDTDPNSILVKNGRRQVLATIKTLLRLNPRDIVAMEKEKES